MLKPDDAKNRANHLLKRLRGEHDISFAYSCMVNEIRTFVMDGILTFKELNTTEEELIVLEKIHLKIQADRYLSFLRKYEYRDACHRWLSAIRVGNTNEMFTLADIGTDEAELEKLEKKHLKIEATRCLDALRNSGCPKKCPRKQFSVRTSITNGILTLEELGTTEKELIGLEGRCEINMLKR